VGFGEVALLEEEKESMTAMIDPLSLQDPAPETLRQGPVQQETEKEYTLIQDDDDPLTQSHKEQQQQQQVVPPSSESVVGSQAGVGVPGGVSGGVSGGGSPTPWASVRVTDPAKMGDGVNAYTMYKVVTETADGRTWVVLRRFRDWVWTRNCLRKEYAGVILPALPPRNVVEKYKMTPEFVEDRRRALERFLGKVTGHATLSQSPELKLFLTANESEFMIESSRLSHALGSAAPAESGGASGLATSALHTASKLWRNITDNANLALHAPQAFSGSSMVQQHVKYEEQSEYVAIRTYYSHLEAVLSEVHQQATRLTRQHERFGMSLSEFGSALHALSLSVGSESPPDAENGETCAVLGKKASAAGQGWVSVSEKLHADFEQPLRELLRAVQSANKTIEDRDEGLVSKIQAQVSVDAKRGLLAKLQATPGTRQDKIMEAERNLQAAIAKSEEASRSYRALVERMDADLVRFQQERQADLHKVLVTFGEILANHNGSASW
jgi:sorting nexin-1/2